MPHGYVSTTGYKAMWLVVGIGAAVCCVIVLTVCLMRIRRTSAQHKDNVLDLRIGDNASVKGKPTTLWLGAPAVK